MLHMILNQMSQETILTIAVSLVSMAWTALKASEWWRVHVSEARYGAAVECLEAGVEVAYQTYVRALKTAAADGKLTDTERAEARKQALEAAIKFGRSRGIDVVAVLGDHYIDVLISQIVERVKGTTAADQNRATIAALAASPDIHGWLESGKL